MAYEYNGFTQQSFDLMFQVRINNSREWYAQHRDEYHQKVVIPMRQLVTALTPLALKIDPDMQVTPAIGKTISRVNRDTRFSKDKSLYRDTIWFFLRKQGRGWVYSPGYYFEVTPVSYSFGVGIAGSTSAIMGTYRNKIRDDVEYFKKIIKKAETIPNIVVQGDMYKKDIAPDLPDELKTYYNRKEIFFTYNSDDMDSLANPDFPEAIISAFEKLAPFYSFFDEVWEQEIQQNIKR